MDEKDLKIMAFRERLAELTTEYEDKVADLRVALTTLQESLNEANERVDTLSSALEAREDLQPAEDLESSEVIEGEVV